MACNLPSDGRRPFTRTSPQPRSEATPTGTLRCMAARPDDQLARRRAAALAGHQHDAATARALQLSRFDMKYSAGQLPHELLLRSIELYGTEVIPRVRKLLAEDG